MRHVGEKLRLVAIGRLQFTALCLDLPEKSRVMDRQSRLRGESLQEFHNFRFEFSDLSTPDAQTSHDLLFTQDGHREQRTVTQPIQDRSYSRDRSFLGFKGIHDLHWRSCACRLTGCAFTQTDARRLKYLNRLGFHVVARPQVKLLRGLVVFVNNTAIGSRQLDGPRDDGLQHSLKIEGRAYRLADLAQGFHFFYGLDQLTCPFLQLLE